MAENITAVDAFKAMIENSKQLTEINNLLKSQCDFTASTHKYVKQIAANLNEIKELMERAEVQTQKLPETAPIENPYKRKISSFPEVRNGNLRKIEECFPELDWIRSFPTIYSRIHSAAATESSS